MANDIFTKLLEDFFGKDEFGKDTEPSWREWLPKVIEQVYLASLRREEGRDLRFTVAIDQRAYHNESRPPGRHFAEARNCSADEFVRFAPAIHGTEQVLLVYDAGEGGPRFYGVNRFVPQPADKGDGYQHDCCRRKLGFVETHNGTSLPAQFATYSNSGICVEVLGPGRIRLRGFNRYSELNELEVASSVKSLTEFEPFIEWLKVATGWNEEHLPCVLMDWCDIIKSIQNCGHGGTIIWVPNESLAEGFLKVKYKVGTDFWGYFGIGSSHAPKDLLTARKENCATPLDHKGHHQSVLSVAAQKQLLAGLCNTDGAVLISGALTVVGSGCEIQYDRSELEGNVFKLDAITEKKISFDIERVGMRNRSAMWFCKKVPEAWLFVVSQDGDLRIYRNDAAM